MVRNGVGGYERMKNTLYILGSLFYFVLSVAGLLGALALGTWLENIDILGGFFR